MSKLSDDTLAEIARLGDEIYETQIRSEVEPNHMGEIVAVDVHSGAYALGDTALNASKRLRSDHPGC
jgi:hypothetical protein